MWALLPRHIQLVIVVWLTLGVAWGLDVVVGQSPSPFHRVALIVTIVEFGLVAAVQLFWRAIWRKFPILGRRYFPDLTGRWEGLLKPSRADVADIPVVIEIRQSLFSVSVRLTTAGSQSSSGRAWLEVSDDKAVFRIAYEYANRPLAAVRTDSPMHEGHARLEFHPAAPGRLTGDYYTSRTSSGDVEVRLVSPDPDAGAPAATS